MPLAERVRPSCRAGGRVFVGLSDHAWATHGPEGDITLIRGTPDVAAMSAYEWRPSCTENELVFVRTRVEEDHVVVARVACAPSGRCAEAERIELAITPRGGDERHTPLGAIGAGGLVVVAWLRAATDPQRHLGVAYRAAPIAELAEAEDIVALDPTADDIRVRVEARGGHAWIVMATERGSVVLSLGDDGPEPVVALAP